MSKLPIYKQASHDYIQSYEQALAQLSVAPNDRGAQHAAVLNLARLGALDLAEREYIRYGLDKITDDEDIMALAGRLAKDRYLRQADKTSATQARRAADLYAKAYHATGGYFSGINAGTMARMAGEDTDTVTHWAEKMLAQLPDPSASADVNMPEDHYFMQATRAECYLLLQRLGKAAGALKEAVNYDPLNYAAHASTLKQFRMILDAKATHSVAPAPIDWLAPLSPPKALHFAGHNFSQTDITDNLFLSKVTADALAITVSDHIQSADIGFGYGALAAGSDILIAEALLMEGGDLHVVLPVDIDLFETESVAPYGAEWVTRFRACLAQAASVDIVSESTAWPEPHLNMFAGNIAMGKAILQAQSLESTAVQCVIYDTQSPYSYTADHVRIWAQTGRPQLQVDYPIHRTNSPTKASSDPPLKFVVVNPTTDSVQVFTSLKESVDACLARSEGLGLCVGLDVKEATQRAQALATIVQPGMVLVSQYFASLMALTETSTMPISYVGTLDLDTSKTRLRAYSFAGPV